MARHTVAELREVDPSRLTDWERRWQRYFQDHPETLASYRYTNGLEPYDSEED